jgi:Skp family chaperone for outer membrane proteins
MRPIAGLILSLGLLYATPAQVFAQTQPMSIRVLDEDRLFRESRLGQGIVARLREAETALERENAEIFDRLAAEERDLTALRATLDTDEFRARADAFDRRVEEIRAERAQRAQDLARQSDAQTRAFFETALPVLVTLLSELGVVALLKPDTLILGADWLDITDSAILRLDAVHPGPPPD